MLAASDYMTHSSPSLASFGRNVFGLRREPSFDTDVHLGTGNHELIDFQTHVADLLGDLAAAGDEEILSLLWLRKLLDTFLLCLEEFRGLLISNRRRGLLRESLLGDFLDRGVKALDFCNAACDGVERLRQCRRHLEVVLVAFGGGGSSVSGSALSAGRALRARKAISELALLMFDEKDARSERNRGRGRGRQSRSYFLLAPSSWSAARELQVMASNIVPPRSQDIFSTSGLAVAVYTMNSVLFFVTWALVVALPCQDRGLHVHFAVPHAYLWSGPVMSLYDRIMEESKEKNRRSSKGLLREIQQMKKVSQQLYELKGGEAVQQYPVAAADYVKKEAEFRLRLEEAAQISSVLQDWLDPVESNIREVSRRISRCRAESFDYFSSDR